MHWCGFVLSSELCTRETLVLLASRNGGHSWTPDFGLGVESPLDPISQYLMEARKAQDFSDEEPVIDLSQIVSFQHLQIRICYTPLSMRVNPVVGAEMLF